jgi:Reverse transcriptase (RNA-dependent DNA polymerase)
MAKATVGTYEDLCRWENLYDAWRAAARGKRGRGPAAAFEYRLEENLVRLQEDLAGETYSPGAYDNFTIHEPKRRLISAAPFRDRVVHHALCRITEPAFEAGFFAHSYANRLGKGTHRALDTAQRWLKRHRYVLSCDIRQFFPSVDHVILQGILERRIQDGGIRRLVRKILASGEGLLAGEYDMKWFPGDDLFAINRPRGLPIGNLTSQFWANCYMDGFDHFVTRQLGCRAYLRYVDDILLFADDKRQLRAWLVRINQRLGALRLSLHQRRSVVCPCAEGVRFLGFVLYPTHRRLLRRKGIHFRRKLKAMMRAYAMGTMGRADFEAALRGWINHVRYADTWGLRQTIFKGVVL